MATNNNGNLLDSSGNVFVDFAWGNFPMQPNDDRSNVDYDVDKADLASEVVAADASENVGWSGYSVYPSARLNPNIGPHAIVEAKYAGYPAFTGNNDGAYVSGTAYISVPNVLGMTVAVGKDVLRDAGYEIGNITTATAATNAAKTVTRVNVTAADVAVIYATGANTAYPVGTKVTVDEVEGIPDEVVGTWTVTAVASGNITVAGSGFEVADSTDLTAAAALSGAEGTLKTQSTAAGAASVASTATITITPWAAAS